MDKYFSGIKCYVRGDENGIWIETEYLDIKKCKEIEKASNILFYKIKI